MRENILYGADFNYIIGGILMGVSVGLYSYDCKGLVNELKEYTKAQDTKEIEEILLLGGSIVGDRYIILNNEFWDEYNAYFGVSEIIDKKFNVQDSFRIFLDDKNTERVSLRSGFDDDLYSILYKMGIDYD